MQTSGFPSPCVTPLPQAADRAQKEKREQTRLDELRRAGHLDDALDTRPRRTNLALPAIMLHAHEDEEGDGEENGDGNGDGDGADGGDQDMDGRESSESEEEDESAEEVAVAKPKRTLRARRRMVQQSIRNRLRLNLASRRNRLRGGRR